jgi:hypothetical protein
MVEEAMIRMGTFWNWRDDAVMAAEKERWRGRAPYARLSSDRGRPGESIPNQRFEEEG